METIRTFCFLLAALLGPVAFAQTHSLTPTTLSAAVSDTQTTIVHVASATDFAAQTTSMWVDGELMPVVGVSGTSITVLRGGAGTRVSTHASGAKVYVGQTHWFYAYGPGGSCTLASVFVHPWIDTRSGTVFDCVDSLWVPRATAEPVSDKHVGTAATGVTATEYGSGRHHVTKLTFTDLAVGSPAGAADLAFGKLLYTLPAGVIAVRTAYMSVGLEDTGGVVDADTPDVGIGTTVGSGANATLNLVAGAENVLTGQTANDVTGTAEVKTVVDQVLAVEAADHHTVYLNVADGWAGADAVTATGTVVIEWDFLQ